MGMGIKSKTALFVKKKKLLSNNYLPMFLTLIAIG